MKVFTLLTDTFTLLKLFSTIYIIKLLLVSAKSEQSIIHVIVIIINLAGGANYGSFRGGGSRTLCVRLAHEGLVSLREVIVGRKAARVLLLGRSGSWSSGGGGGDGSSRLRGDLLGLLALLGLLLRVRFLLSLELGLGGGGLCLSFSLLGSDLLLEGSGLDSGGSLSLGLNRSGILLGDGLGSSLLGGGLLDNRLRSGSGCLGLSNLLLGIGSLSIGLLLGSLSLPLGSGSLLLGLGLDLGDLLA